MPTNPWGVTTSGERLGSYSGDAVRPSSPFGNYFGAGTATTFSTLQRQGVARPPAPAPMPASPTGVTRVPLPPPTMARPPLQPRPVSQPPVTVPPGGAYPTGDKGPVTAVPVGGPIFTEGPGFMQPQFNIGDILKQRYLNPQQSPVDQSIQQRVMQLLQKPSAYDSDQAKTTFERLRQGLDESYDVDQQKLKEEMASRGLGDSTIYGGRLGDLSVQHGRDLSSLAGQVIQDQAKTQASDTAQAIATAMGFSGQQSGNLQQALQNLLGYGQQSFQNQVTTQNLNNDQQQQQIQLLLALLGQI